MISVIVPVYNSEKYLGKCINSILGQTFQDFELLLIDDGSTDGSGEICDRYAVQDSRIKVFHKQNGGVASAREMGKNMASGDYSIHVDSDDWIEKDMLEVMYDEVCERHLDMVIADFYNDMGEQSIYVKQGAESVEPKNILTNILQDKLFGGLWHKMIRHDLYKKYDIHFINGIDYCEDVLVLAQLLSHPLKIGFIPKAFYHYNFSNINSITRNYTVKTYQMRKAFICELHNMLPQSFAEIIKEYAVRIKKEAFVNGVLSDEDFKTFMPLSIKEILISKVLGRKAKVCFVMAQLGFYKLAVEFSRVVRA